MPHSAPDTATFYGESNNDECKAPGHKVSVQLPEYSVPEDPLLGKYLEPEKVNVVLVRNCGILLEEPAETSFTSGGRSKSERRKRDSLYQHKIPVEIRRNEKSGVNKKGWRRFGGVIFGVWASLCFSLTLLIAKILRESHSAHPVAITVWRYLGILAPALPISLFYSKCTSEPIWDSVWPLNAKNLKNYVVYVMQGICGCSSIIFRFYSLEFISLADATVVAFSSPVFVTLLAHFCLGERCSLLSLLLGGLTLLGVGVIARPPLLKEAFGAEEGPGSHANVWIGVILAVASMLCASGLLVLMRNVRGSHYSLMLLVSGGWGVGQSAVLGAGLSVLELPRSVEAASLVGLLGVATFLGQMGIILALKYENAGAVAMIRSSEVVFAFIWQAQWFGEWPDGYSLGGAVIIVVAVVVTGGKAWIGGRKSDGGQRKRVLVLGK